MFISAIYRKTLQYASLSDWSDLSDNNSVIPPNGNTVDKKGVQKI